MLESFKAAGLDPIVLDENTDFSKLVVASNKHETNTEFLTRIMAHGCPTGALVQGMIMRAVESFAKVVAAEPDPNVFDSMFINGEAWRATGVWLTEQFETRYAKG